MKRRSDREQRKLHDILRDAPSGHYVYDRNWNPALLPEKVSVCALCSGLGSYRQTYTAGCGSGHYQATGPCDYCGELGLRYDGNDGIVPLSVVQQIVVAHNRATGEEHAESVPGQTP